jgi:hypothetical protein
MKIKILTWCGVTGELPLFLASYTRSYECIIVSKRYIKFQRPKICVQSPTITPIRLLQKRLTRYEDWIIIIHPRVILPDDFWDILESECTNPEALYGADTLLYDSIDILHVDLYEGESISCNGYLQIYSNAARYPPVNKIYSDKFNSDILFRDLWTKCNLLPLNIKFILNDEV